ncbi:hypothetical protein Tco_0906878 [Tanacetum coccineum]|uniref:Reverse transcriptase domain-containing protein n=1 Tax=Tanacetum coccineum TaxID=301880 RepID=A0ABQ5CIM8_9ASTR
MIPLSRGSFDVIVGIDWLSKRKFVIVCYEKVIRIPLEGDEIFRVHEEHTLGAAKALMNAKVDEPRISDIPVKYELSVEQEEAFQTLKNDLCDTPINRIKATWFRATDGKKRRREFVLYGSNLGSIGRKCNGCDPCIKVLGVKAAMSKTFGLLQQPEIALSEKLRYNHHGFITKFPRSQYVSMSDLGDGRLDRPIRNENSRADQLRVEDDELPRGLADAPKVFSDAIDSILLRHPPSGMDKVNDTDSSPERIRSVCRMLNLHVAIDENQGRARQNSRLIEEPVEIMDREIRKLKHKKVVLVKVRWNSKRGPEFTWEHEDQKRIKYPQLFMDRVFEPAS